MDAPPARWAGEQEIFSMTGTRGKLGLLVELDSEHPDFYLFLKGSQSLDPREQQGGICNDIDHCVLSTLSSHRIVLFSRFPIFQQRLLPLHEEIAS